VADQDRLPDVAPSSVRQGRALRCCRDPGASGILCPHRGFAAVQTHDGLTLIIVGGWPYAEFAANKHDVDGHFLRMLDLAPAFAERMRGAKREARFAGATLPNYFHVPYGPGWVLVGDAGYIKDSITAQGMTDAFLDAERCAIALGQVFSGARSFDAAMGEYHRDRDERVLAMYELTCELATLEPPPPHMQQLLAAIVGDQHAMDDFVRMNAGTIPPAEFLTPDRLAAVMSSS
jgi:2-polyprenyl-6-methoxyphenol hydroxylase-like FAD-dependent oxidoreductase